MYDKDKGIGAYKNQSAKQCITLFNKWGHSIVRKQKTKFMHRGISENGSEAFVFGNQSRTIKGIAS